MKNLCLCSSGLNFPASFLQGASSDNNGKKQCPERNTFAPQASKSAGGFSMKPAVSKKCQTCKGQGAIECTGCKGTGKNKKNGNIFERWKCFDCQGFGLKSCPVCGKGGLTPEQRGER